MKIIMVLLGFFFGWFAIISQLYLMMENSTVTIPETIFWFFSFITILTNTHVAAYFTFIFFLGISYVYISMGKKWGKTLTI